MITSWASSTMQILDQIGWMGAFPKQVKYDFSSNVTTLTLGLWHVSSVCRPSVGLWRWKCTVQLFVNILQQQQYLGTIGGLCLFGKEIQGYWSCKEGRMYGMNKKLSCRTMLRVIEYFDKSLKSRSFKVIGNDTLNRVCDIRISIPLQLSHSVAQQHPPSIYLRSQI